MPVVGFLRGDGFSLIEAVTLLHHFPGSGFIEKYGDRIEGETERVWDKVTDRPNQGKPPGGTITQDQVAQRFAREFGERLRYCHHTGAWFQWCGSHWQRDETALAFNFVRELGRRMTAAATDGDKKQVRSVTFAGGVEKFAKSDPIFAVTSERWDRDTFLLGTPGGTVDLRTGILREPDQADHITKVTAVAPADTIDCPRWLEFLKETFGRDAGGAGIIRFVQQWCGYSLTGDTREHALVFGYGGGGNGKSVLLNAITGIMQDYAVTAAMDTFIASQSERHPTDLAMLRGARMVTASETEEGRAWAESRIKQITGGDKISARFMRQDFFEFLPQFKLTIIGNHRPVLKNIDEAARRRFNLVPFVRKPGTPDRELEAKLKAEWPGILRWMIEGCLDWQANGLVRPESVKAATEDYFAEQDLIGQWLDEECDIEPGNTHKFGLIADLYDSWKDFCEKAGENPGTKKMLSGLLLKRGFAKCTVGHSKDRGFRGIRVNSKSSYHSEGGGYD
ncbi:phage/plasmid primase, P4 family [Bosea sp. NBC_00550]|nr:phage/plasmid primase, P4 family [Bosea sp. NBC_00550]